MQYFLRENLNLAKTRKWILRPTVGLMRYSVWQHRRGIGGGKTTPHSSTLLITLRRNGILVRFNFLWKVKNKSKEFGTVLKQIFVRELFLPLSFPFSLPFCWSGHVDLLKNYKKNVLLAMERNCLWQNHPLSQVSPTFTEKVSKKVQKGKK